MRFYIYPFYVSTRTHKNQGERRTGLCFRERKGWREREALEKFEGQWFWEHRRWRSKGPIPDLRKAAPVAAEVEVPIVVSWYTRTLYPNCLSSNTNMSHPITCSALTNAVKWYFFDFFCQIQLNLYSHFNLSCCYELTCFILLVHVVFVKMLSLLLCWIIGWFLGA